MRRVLADIERRTAVFAAHPLFTFLRGAEPRHGLSLAPVLSHFVMTFADLYRLVLRVEPAPDQFQKLVNAHTYEDGGHWKWFLSDLTRLGHDPQLPFTESLALVWGARTVELRKLSYHMCRLGLGASSLEKLVLVHCIEATGSVMLSSIAPLGRAVSQETGERLVYFGPHHFETESDHTLEQESTHGFVSDVRLEAPAVERLLDYVEHAFAPFMSAADELHDFARTAAAERVDAFFQP